MLLWEQCLYPADVPDGQNVPEEECVKLLILYKSSTNFMEKAYTVKRLYNLRLVGLLSSLLIKNIKFLFYVFTYFISFYLREYCYLVVRQDGSDESADVDLKKHIM